MRFYYVSLFSVILLFVIWFVGTGLLVWLGSHLRKTRKRVWPVMLPLFLLLYLGPIAEELWIAWHFGQLCKKDAGIFIHKTVEVDGFYDDITHWWRQLAESDYQFVESRERGRNILWRVERDGETLRHFEIDQPTARYHYRWPDRNEEVRNKIWRNSEAVIDTQTNDVLAGSVRYGRQAPWFFVGLDRPGMSCPRPGEDPLKQPGLLYKQVLAPKKGSR